jgi:hypothetical protein
MRHLLSALVFAFTLGAAAPALGQEARSAPAWSEQLQESIPPFPATYTTVKAPWLRVHGHPDQLDAMMRVADHGAEALPRLAERLGVPVGTTVQIVVASTDAEFRALQPGRAPTWADAVAYPALGVIYLRAPSARGGDQAPIEQVLDHELVHVLLGRAFAPARPPSWLQEGVAQVLAGEAGPELAGQIATGMATGGLIDLSTLERGFPRDARRAQLAYAQSADFVAWLEDQHGDDVIPRLVQHTREGNTLAASVRHVTGDFLEEVEARWRRRFTANTTFALSGLFNEGLLFSVGGLMLAVGGVQRKRQFRRRMVELEAEEAAIDRLAAEVALRRSA